MEIGGKRMIDHTISSISQLFPVYVAGKDNSEHYISEKLFITDLYSVSTPLLGLYSALMTVNEETIFLISGDMPFARKNLILFLKSQLSKEVDAVIPFFKKPQMTFAFYKKSCLQTVLEAIESGHLSLKGLLKELKVKYIYEREMRVFDRNLISFFNMNTKEQFKVGEKLFASIDR